MILNIRPLLRRAFAVTLVLSSSASLHAGLVLHLPFNEGEGVITKNSADTSAPGIFSVTGSGWTQHVPETFVSRTAYQNTGEDGSYVSVKGDSEGIQTFADFTVTGWVYASEVNGVAGAFDRILSKRDEIGSRAVDVGFMNSGSGVNVGVGIGILVGSLKEVVTQPINFSEGWVFFAITRMSDTGEVSIYLGQSDPNRPVELERNGYGTPGTMKNRGPLLIGNTPMGLKRAAQASYSDIRVYDEVLEPEQIEIIRKENLSTAR